MHVLISALLVAASGGLSIDVDSPKKTILVGEPVKLVVRWTAQQRLKTVYVEREDFSFQSLYFVVTGSSGTREYREIPHAVTEQIIVPGGLEKGQQEITNLVLLYGKSGFLFPSAGKYSLVAVYTHGEQPSWEARSNALTFTVKDAAGDDQAVLEEVRRDPTVLTAEGDARSQARTRELVKKYPDSPYLGWAKLQIAQQKATSLHNRFDPETGESLSHLSRKELAEFTARRHRQMAEEILAKQDWGALEEEALGLALAYAAGAGDDPMAREARERLLERHPQSVAAKELREAEALKRAEEEDEEEDP